MYVLIKIRRHQKSCQNAETKDQDIHDKKALARNAGIGIKKHDDGEKTADCAQKTGIEKAGRLSLVPAGIPEGGKEKGKI